MVVGNVEMPEIRYVQIVSPPNHRSSISRKAYDKGFLPSQILNKLGCFLFKHGVQTPGFDIDCEVTAQADAWSFHQHEHAFGDSAFATATKPKNWMITLVPTASQTWSASNTLPQHHSNPTTHHTHGDVPIVQTTTSASSLTNPTFFTFTRGFPEPGSHLPSSTLLPNTAHTSTQHSTTHGSGNIWATESNIPAILVFLILSLCLALLFCASSLLRDNKSDSTATSYKTELDAAQQEIAEQANTISCLKKGLHETKRSVVQQSQDAAKFKQLYSRSIDRFKRLVVFVVLCIAKKQMELQSYQQKTERLEVDKASLEEEQACQQNRIAELQELLKASEALCKSSKQEFDTKITNVVNANASHAEHILNLEHRIKHGTEELTYLQTCYANGDKSYKELQKKFESLRGANLNLTQQIRTLENEKSALQADVTKAKQDSNGYDANLSTLRQDRQKHLAEILKKSNENVRLREELDAERKKPTTVDQAVQCDVGQAKEKPINVDQAVQCDVDEAKEKPTTIDQAVQCDVDEAKDTSTIDTVQSEAKDTKAASTTPDAAAQREPLDQKQHVSPSPPLNAPTGPKIPTPPYVKRHHRGGKRESRKKDERGGRYLQLQDSKWNPWNPEAQK